MRDYREMEGNHHHHQPGEAPENNNELNGDLDEGLVLNPEDVVEVIDIDDNPPNDEAVLVEDLGEMDLENEESEEDEGMVDGAEGGAPPREDAETVYTAHTGSVFCVAVDPKDGKLAVSGGEDDRAFVWQTHNGNTLIECTGHKDSVTCVGISHDASYVATGDMSGVIKAWKVATQQEIWSFEVGDLEWALWHHSAPVLLAGTAEGEMWMWKIPSGDTKTFTSPGCTCTVGRILPDGKRACSGYEDGSVRTWDLKTGNAIHTFSGNAGHTSSVTSMACHGGNSLVMTGSTDVTAKLYNTASNKLICTFNCESQMQEGEDEQDSVEDVGFSNALNLAATGTLSGMLTVWDINTQTPRQKCKHEAGIVRLRWDPATPLLYTSTLDGAVHLWDGRSGQREKQWFGHSGSVLDLDISRDGSLLVTGSEDKTARVFSLSQPER